MSHAFSNKLINETSKYLLQHAHNPVNWFAWCDEALQKAKSENKIILISIGYSACHWCHVMEKESFENETVAKIMNEHFINIKIDREERPDLDHIYMDAVQTLTGSGGWPLNVFLTPDAKPFYGGTYFPPEQAHSRVSWTTVLLNVSQSWLQKSEDILTQASNLTNHIIESNQFGFAKTEPQNNEAIFTQNNCALIFENIIKNADQQWGGFGNAPKFPQTFTIQYLLQYYFFTKNETALQQATLSLDKMLQGGIYDHVAGGLARYSTDREWLAPHFEKMLYDNALLINVLCDAYQITKNKNYKIAIEQIIHFVNAELMHPSFGFYAALDADTEGEEGKYYVWQKDEITAILGEDADLFCSFFDVSEQGNWEHKNILRILVPAHLFVTQQRLDINEFESKIQQCLKKLAEQRDKRTKPLLDDKVILGWSALMITALCKAAGALNSETYRQMATTAFTSLWKIFKVDNNSVAMHHTASNGIAKYPAFLDDYSYLIKACIGLQEITSDTNYLNIANQLCHYVIDNFSETSNGFFFYTHKNQTDVIIRKKEVYDGAVPSGNSIMVQNLFYLATIYNNNNFALVANNMLSKLSGAIIKYPTSFGIWASSILGGFFAADEITIIGVNYLEMRNQLLEQYLPSRILMSNDVEDDSFAMLVGKTTNSKTLIYHCKNKTCHEPLQSVDKLLRLLSINTQHN
jgi:uncharacterized protein